MVKPHGLITNVAGGIVFDANPVDGFGLFRWHVMEMLKANRTEYCRKKEGKASKQLAREKKDFRTNIK